MFYCFNLSHMSCFCIIRFPVLASPNHHHHHWERSFAVTFYVTKNIYNLQRHRERKRENNAFGDCENRNINKLWQIVGHWFFSDVLGLMSTYVLIVRMWKLCETNCYKNNEGEKMPTMKSTIYKKLYGYGHSRFSLSRNMLKLCELLYWKAFQVFNVSSSEINSG